MQRGKTEAETLRLNGWGVGDILEGDEGFGPERIWIISVGQEYFLCRWDRECNGHFDRESRNTTLSCREWKKVGYEPVPGVNEPEVNAKPVGTARNAEHPYLTEACFNKKEVPAGTPVHANQPTGLQLSRQQLKAACTEFFYWWSEQPGSNTQQGFDDWFEREGHVYLKSGESDHGSEAEAQLVPHTVREAIEKVRPLICNCSWNPDSHDPECPSGILQDALLKVEGLASQPVTVMYTNWRGESRNRTIVPKSLRFGSTEWHPDPQWLLRALDVEKNAYREFALKDFGSPQSAPSDKQALVIENLHDDLERMNNQLREAEIRLSGQSSAKQEGDKEAPDPVARFVRVHDDNGPLERPRWEIVPLCGEGEEPAPGQLLYAQPLSSEDQECLEECLLWLRSALNCPSWHWDPQQKDCAEEACAKAESLLSKNVVEEA